MSKDVYVLDSSLWIRIGRNEPGIMQRIRPLIMKNAVCQVDLIVAELARSVNSVRDLKSIQEGFSHFSVLTTTWKKVAGLGFQLARRDFYPSMSCLYLAQCVIENRKILITEDETFKHLQKMTPLRVEFFSSQ